jgi:hypothetical protein
LGANCDCKTQGRQVIAWIPRAIVSEIIGVDVIAGVRTCSRIDPLGIKADSKCWRSSMTTIEIPPGLSEADLAALKLAFAKSVASSKARAKQLDEMVKDRGWLEAAEFAAYGCQIDSMRLKPWQEPPCHVADENEPRVGEEAAAKLLHRILKAGISRWHPDPMAALEVTA